MERRSTRSQVTLHDDILQVPQLSPMKQARRSVNTASSSKPGPEDMVEDSESEDELLLSPGKRAAASPSTTGKRSASPPLGEASLDGSPGKGRESKRVKRDDSQAKEVKERGARARTANSHTRNLSDPIIVPKKKTRQKPSRLASEKPRSVVSDEPISRQSSLPPAANGRAQSLPVQFPTSYSYPHVDLTNLPPSPTHSRSRSRSPFKNSTPKMRIKPLPPTLFHLPSIPDEMTHKLDVEMDSPVNESAEEPLSEKSGNIEQQMPLKLTVDTELKTRPVRDVINPIATNGDEESDPPLSPLTPAPDTPHMTEAMDLVKDIPEDRSQGLTAAKDEKPTGTTKSKPTTSIQQPEKQSRLPRPVQSTSQHRAMAINSKTKEPKAQTLKHPRSKEATKGKRSAYDVLMNGRSDAKPKPSANSTFVAKAKDILGNLPGRKLEKGKTNAADDTRPKGGIKAKMKGKGKAEPKPAPALVPIPSDEEDVAMDERMQDLARLSTPTVDEPEMAFPPEAGEPPIPPTTIAESGTAQGDDVHPIESATQHEPTSPKADLNPFIVEDPPVVQTPNEEIEDPAIAEGPIEVPIADIAGDLPPSDEQKISEDSVPSTIEDKEDQELAQEPGPSSQTQKGKSAIGGRKRVPSSLPTAGGRVTRSSSTRKAEPASKPTVPTKTKQTTLNFMKVTSSTAKRKSIGVEKVPNVPEPAAASAISVNDVTASAEVATPPKTKSFPKGSPMRIADSPVRRSPRNISTSKSTPTLKTPSSSPSKLRKPVPVPSSSKRARSASPSPTKKAVRSASIVSNRPSVNLSENRFAQSGSTLSTLSSALEQLRMPPPSRPSTSLGFNRDGDDDDDSLFGSRNQSQDDSAVGNKQTGSFKSSGVGRSATLGASHFSNKEGAAGAKVSKPGPFARPARGRPLFGLNGGPLVRRHTTKASRNPTLPPVMGSPVKGGGGGDITMFRDDSSAMNTDDVALVGTNLQRASNADDSDMDVEASEITKGKGKERVTEDYSSRRASMASHFLSQSLTSLLSEPATGKGSMGPPPLPSNKQSGSRSPNQSPSTTEEGSSAGTPPGRRSTRTAAAAASQAIANVAASSRRAPPVEEKPAPDEALKFLKDCTIFVDVRTEDGEEAGSLFIQMLEVAGARLLSRVGQSCTHIVYKNGVQSTINRYRLLRDPKPLVVGIAWVVECVEQRKRVDETEHLIDLEEVSLFTNPSKRRRSMLPKLVSREISDFASSSETNKDDSNEGDVSMEGSNSSLILDDLTPLERARSRRKSILPPPGPL